MNIEFTEKLIEEVRKRPLLYVQDHPDKRNNSKKFQAWKEIQKEFPDDDVAVLKSKWRNLKDSYSKYKRAKSCDFTQGAIKLHNWAWAEQMSFIDDKNINETQYTASVNKESDDNDNNSISNEEKLLFKPQDNGNILIPNPQETCDTGDSIDRILNYLESRRNFQNDGKVGVRCDGVDLLFLGYADTFKKLSKEKQAKVKFEIAKIFMEAELGDIGVNTKASGSSMKMNSHDD